MSLSHIPIQALVLEAMYILLMLYQVQHHHLQAQILILLEDIQLVRMQLEKSMLFKLKLIMIVHAIQQEHTVH